MASGTVLTKSLCHRPRTSASLPRGVALRVGSAPGAQRDVEGPHVTISGPCCDVQSLVTLKSRRPRPVPSDTAQVTVGVATKPIYGDLLGNARNEPAMEVVCHNGSGTAGGQIAFA